MTPAALAKLHALCFSVPRPFTEDEFTELLASDLAFLCVDPHGFALGRAVAGEAELLTLAVHPDHRRAGIGRRLLFRFEDNAKERGATAAFLEVAATNEAACRLYQSAGYSEAGRRRKYYAPKNRPPIDAVVMAKTLGPR